MSRTNYILRYFADCTVKALTHRISTIKKKAEGAGGAAASGDAAAAKPATPRKRAKKADTDGDGGSATKKAKTNGAGARATKKTDAPAAVEGERCSVKVK